MLLNYDRYQKIWRRNLQHIEEARNRINDSTVCENHKANKQQSARGDVTVQERIDDAADKEGQRTLLEVAFPHRNDGEARW